MTTAPSNSSMSHFHASIFTAVDSDKIRAHYVQKQRELQSHTQLAKRRLRCERTHLYHFLIVSVIAMTMMTLWNPHFEVSATGDFDLILRATTDSVLYDEGYIRGKGHIDLSAVIFQAVSESGAYYQSRGTGDDDYDDAVAMDDYSARQGENGADDYTFDGGSQRVRKLVSSLEQFDGVNEMTTSSRSSSRQLEGGIDHDATFIDIAVVPLPRSCSRHPSKCPWVDLGIGKMKSTDEIRWCCDDDAFKSGLCSASSMGRLMISETKFTGTKRAVSIAKTGAVKKVMSSPIVEVSKSKMYAIVFANCDANEGRDVSIKGNVIWKSQHGYLPGELYVFMMFYFLVTAIFAAMLVWFGFLMITNFKTQIGMEWYIVLAITLGLLEMISRSADYVIWNQNGSRSKTVLWFCIILGVFKQAFSHCVAVMVSMGYGISCDTLTKKDRSVICCLGTAYVLTSCCYDFTVAIATKNINQLTERQGVFIIDIATVLINVERIIDVCFLVLILTSLRSTIETCERTGETKKLVRTQQLRTIFVASGIFAVVMAAISFVDDFMYNRLRKQHSDDDGDSDDVTVSTSLHAEELAWLKDVASEINYTFVLIGIAILWRPNASAREYAYFKKLETESEDDEFRHDNDRWSGGNGMIEISTRLTSAGIKSKV